MTIDSAGGVPKQLDLFLPGISLREINRELTSCGQLSENVLDALFRKERKRRIVVRR